MCWLAGSAELWWCGKLPVELHYLQSSISTRCRDRVEWYMRRCRLQSC